MAERTIVLHEPLNPDTRSLTPSAHRRFPYIPSSAVDAHKQISGLLDLRFPLVDFARDRDVKTKLASVREWVRWSFGRLRSDLLVMKDPTAIFSTEWLAENYFFRPVIVVRHPAGVVSSLARLGWRTDFREWIADEAFMETLPVALAKEVEGRCVDESLLLNASTLWNVCSWWVQQIDQQQPSWFIKRYEELVSEPEAAVRELYDYVGKPYTSSIQRGVQQSLSGSDEIDPSQATEPVDRNGSAVVSTWRSRLSVREQRDVRAATEAWASPFYNEADW